MPVMGGVTLWFNLFGLVAVGHSALCREHHRQLQLTPGVGRDTITQQLVVCPYRSVCRRWRLS